WSDGDGAPELVTAWYRSHGYQFLVLSDHNLLSTGDTWFPIGEKSRLTSERVQDLCSRFGQDSVEMRQGANGREMRLKTLAELRARFERPDEFLLLQGEEITDDVQGKAVHVNGLNLTEAVAPQGGATVLEAIQHDVDAVIAQGQRQGRAVLAHVNHP